jgi:hypothetical protein
MSKKNPLKYHFTQIYGIKSSESDLDFFDANLRYDTTLFIDPFLLKNSPVKSDQVLFDRFGIFFKDAIEKFSKINIEKSLERKIFIRHIDFGEPKQLCLGYTAGSNKGKGPGKEFAKALFNFFVDISLKKIIENESYYPDKRINPAVLGLVSKNIGPDGISDLAISLILDYLISYTQEVCKKYGIKTQTLPTPKFFSFEFMEWVNGKYAELPKNPYTNDSVILVPKRFLRAQDINRDRKITGKLQCLLEMDPDLKIKFADFIQKNVSDITIDEVHVILKENPEVIKDILLRMESENPGQYDFVLDPYKLLAIKKFAELIVKKEKNNIATCQQLLNELKTFLTFFQRKIIYNGHWKDFWEGGKSNLKESSEEAVGRLFHALGLTWFKDYNEVTFCNEVSNGNGFVDFYLIYKECRIVIELKKLSNSQPSGEKKIPAYKHGIMVQLPEYAIQHEAKYAFYLTAQHHKSNKKGEQNHDKRVEEITKLLPDINNFLKDNIENFDSLHYVNIDISPKDSPSKK